MALAAPLAIPPELKISFAWTRVRGNRVYVAGHSARLPDGSPAEPFGKVPTEASLDAARHAARLTALSILGSLRRRLGGVDHVSAWLTVFGLVNAEPGYGQTTNVINDSGDLILELYGPERGENARVAAGVGALPLNNAGIVAAEVEIDG